MTVLLLVVIMGRPLKTYLQSLILVVMLGSELVYECIRRPIRFSIVWRLQLATIAILTLSLFVSLFTADFQATASSKGLGTISVMSIIGNLVLCLLFVWYIVVGYKESAVEWLQWGRRHMPMASNHTPFRQFIQASATSETRRPSGEPMLLSAMSSPARGSSIELSQTASSSYSPEGLRRVSAALASQELNIAVN